VHQAPPTAKGHHFVTLEDAEGLINAVVRPAVVTQIKKLPFRHGYGLNDWPFVLVEGIVKRNGDVVNILATSIQPLTTIALSSVAIDPIRASLH
jgi:hypothetical protein